MADILQKDEAHKLIDQMPQNATWDDLMHQIYVRHAIEKGMTDSKAGRSRSAGAAQADVRIHRIDYGRTTE